MQRLLDNHTALEQMITNTPWVGRTMRMIPRIIFVCCLLTALGLVRGADAHPFGPKYYSFRTVIVLDGTTLKLTTAVEAPTMKVLEEYAKLYGHLDEIGEREDREFFELMLKRIGDGLTVTIDGKAVQGSWVRADSPINGRADEQFFYYIVQFEAVSALPTGPCEIVLTNRIYQDEESYHSGWIKPSAGWKVVESISSPWVVPPRPRTFRRSMKPGATTWRCATCGSRCDL